MRMLPVLVVAGVAAAASAAAPADTALVTIVRDGRVIVPSPDDPLEAGDELLFVASAAAEQELQELFSPHLH